MAPFCVRIKNRGFQEQSIVAWRQSPAVTEDDPEGTSKLLRTRNWGRTVGIFIFLCICRWLVRYSQDSHLQAVTWTHAKQQAYGFYSVGGGLSKVSYVR